jgi:putative (di)nucleoside polyphosphate hydrolase
VQKMGLEWLFRLISQPHRIKRILHAVILFPWRCLVWRFRIHFVYRENVAAAIINSQNEILLVTPAWSRKEKWQFPQGGVDPGESGRDAILREMKEELGTGQFKILAEHKEVYHYDWPHWYQVLRGYKGQKQDVFLLRFIGENSDFDIEKEGELAAWKWVKRSAVVNELAPARKSIGKIVMDLIDGNSSIQ